jgi:hypothetical protein
MSQPLAKARKPVRLHECGQNMHVLLVSKALLYGKNEEHYTIIRPTPPHQPLAPEDAHPSPPQPSAHPLPQVSDQQSGKQVSDP